MKITIKTFVSQSGDVSFISVPAFIYKTDIKIELPIYGKITFDISYGGAFYALIDVTQVKLHLRDTPINELVRFSTMLTDHVKETIDIKHPVEEDLGFLYGAILTDGKDEFCEEEETHNICVFADRQVCYRFLISSFNCNYKADIQNIWGGGVELGKSLLS